MKISTNAARWYLIQAAKKSLELSDADAARLKTAFNLELDCTNERDAERLYLQSDYCITTADIIPLLRGTR